MSVGLRPDLSIIAANIQHDSRVLDVGCGDGYLMDLLQAVMNCDVRGLEIEPELVGKAVSKGLSVIQGDADSDLAYYTDGGFDYAILSQTLQTTKRPDLVLDELLRVGLKAFVSFPNFAHWKVRANLLWNGRMPVTRLLPIAWYETPNIHHVTVRDFRELVAEKGYRVESEWFLSGDHQISPAAAAWRAEHAVFLLSR